MKTSKVAIPILAACLLVTGCCFNRASVAKLSEAQSDYFAKLGQTLKTNRALLELGLSEQLKSDVSRQRRVLQWERDLVKAEVLLQVDTDGKADAKLLLMKLAEIDLSTFERMQGLEAAGTVKVAAVMKAYDALIAAAESLAKNNQVITKYLGDRNATYALRSLDVEAMAAAITGTQNVRRDLEGAQTLSNEEKKKQTERLQKDIERARDVIVKALANKEK